MMTRRRKRKKSKGGEGGGGGEGGRRGGEQSSQSWCWTRWVRHCPPIIIIIIIIIIIVVVVVVVDVVVVIYFCCVALSSGLFLLSPLQPVVNLFPCIFSSSWAVLTPSTSVSPMLKFKYSQCLFIFWPFSVVYVQGLSTSPFLPVTLISTEALFLWLPLWNKHIQNELSRSH